MLLLTGCSPSRRWLRRSETAAKWTSRVPSDALIKAKGSCLSSSCGPRCRLVTATHQSDTSGVLWWERDRMWKPVEVLWWVPSLLRVVFRCPSQTQTVTCRQPEDESGPCRPSPFLGLLSERRRGFYHTSVIKVFWCCGWLRPRRFGFEKS